MYALQIPSYGHYVQRKPFLSNGGGTHCWAVGTTPGIYPKRHTLTNPYSSLYK